MGISAETTAPIIPEKHHAQLTSAGASIVDHILVGEPWSDELVDAANDRRFDSGRAIDF